MSRTASVAVVVRAVVERDRHLGRRRVVRVTIAGRTRSAAGRWRRSRQPAAPRRDRATTGDDPAGPADSSAPAVATRRNERRGRGDPDRRGRDRQRRCRTSIARHDDDEAVPAAAPPALHARGATVAVRRARPPRRPATRGRRWPAPAASRRTAPRWPRRPAGRRCAQPRPRRAAVASGDRGGDERGEGGHGSNCRRTAPGPSAPTGITMPAAP